SNRRQASSAPAGSPSAWAWAQAAMTSARAAMPATSPACGSSSRPRAYRRSPASSSRSGSARVITRGAPDLELLAGDRLYALGLELLPQAGDVAGIAALADVIAACAQAQADGDPAGAEEAWRRL